MSADPLTHAELDAHIRSLTSVGGIYEPLAEVIEHYNRPHCVGKEGSSEDSINEA